MRLSLEIDRQLRLILAVLGRLRGYAGQSPSDALDLIAKSAEAANMPTELRDTLKNFWDLRNLIVHGEGPQHLVMRALDYGFRILRMVQAMPRPIYLVAESGVKLYVDRALSQPRLDVHGVVLESFGSKRENLGQQRYPSRNTYREGQSVTWEWNQEGSGWGETWYFDPRSKEAKLAWSASVEFVGRPLDMI